MRAFSGSSRRLAGSLVLLALLFASTAGAVPRDGRRDRDFVAKVKRFVVAVLGGEISLPPGKP